MAYKQVKSFHTSTIGKFRYCLSYVRRGFRIPATGVPTAWASWAISKTKHRNRNHPKNVDVPIYFSGAGGDGHVIAWVAKKKKYYSSPYKWYQLRATFTNLADIERIYGCTVVGWTEGVSTTRVIEEVKDSSKPKPKPKSKAGRYIVKRGDTLAKIAKKLKTTWRKLWKKNPQIKDPGKIYPGQKIKTIKGTKPAVTYYVIRKGDTLSKIAKKRKTTVKKILALNPQIANKNKIYTNQKIRVK